MTGKPVQRAVTDLIGRPREIDMIVLYFDLDIPVDLLLQLPFGAFHGQLVMLSDRYRYSFGQSDRLFTYTRHIR